MLPPNDISISISKISKQEGIPEATLHKTAEIVSSLADVGIYIASESSFYRVLREYNMQHHRGTSEVLVSKPISTHCATAPNQVWM